MILEGIKFIVVITMKDIYTLFMEASIQYR